MSKVAVGCGLLFALGVLIFGWFLLERWRGQNALRDWKVEKARAGEIFEPERIWPRISPRALVFSNELRVAVGQLPEGLRRYAGLLSGIVMHPSGSASPGSRQAAPPESSFASKGSPGNWQDLAEQIRQARPALELMRQSLSHPPEDAGYGFATQEPSLVIPNFVYLRRTAQALQAAIIYDLHNGNVKEARENLFALAGFSKVYRQDPLLVTYMIRVAILGLSVDTAWDALQAPGWTETQMAELDQAFDWDQLLGQMPHTCEAERAMRLRELNWLCSHAYGDWLQRYEPICVSFGMPRQKTPARLAQQYYREWIFHPLWRFAWADQEQLLYLQAQQPELELLRQLSQTGSWKSAQRTLEKFRGDDQLPAGGWRFYITLPLIDEISLMIGSPPETKKFPRGRFTRAWSITMKNLTLAHLLRTAIALKRYEMRYGHPPDRLEQLQPEFVDRVPQDLMDGQPLRYRLQADRTWVLYSIGDDFEDNLGDAIPAARESQRFTAWDARDWVWPCLEINSKLGASTRTAPTVATTDLNPARSRSAGRAPAGTD